MSSEATRDALMDAAVRLTARVGTRGLTARGIATEAGVNQALVYYHFSGVDGLLHDAYERATLAMIADLTTDLEGVASFDDLYALGARLAEQAADDGSAAVLSHVLAAAHTDELMAGMLRDALQHWGAAIEATVRRILQARGMSGAVDINALTRSLIASTIGMLTLGAVPGQPLGDPLAGVGTLPRLLDRVLRLVPAPIARRVFAQG